MGPRGFGSIRVFFGGFKIIETEKDESTNWGHGAVEARIHIPNTRNDHGSPVKHHDADGKFIGKLTVDGIVINPLGEKILSERFNCTLNGPEEAAQAARQMEIEADKDAIKRSEEYIKGLEDKIAGLRETNQQMWGWK